MRIRYPEHRRLFFIIKCQGLFIAAGKGITFGGSIKVGGIPGMV